MEKSKSCNVLSMLWSSAFSVLIINLFRLVPKQHHLTHVDTQNWPNRGTNYIKKHPTPFSWGDGPEKYTSMTTFVISFLFCYCETLSLRADCTISASLVKYRHNLSPSKGGKFVSLVFNLSFFYSKKCHFPKFLQYISASTLSLPSVFWV